jgi:hypothetical protein
MEARFFSAFPRKSSDSSCVLPAARLTASTFVCGARMATPRANSTRLRVGGQIILPRTSSSAWFTSKRGEQTKPSLGYRESSICPAGCMASARSATSTPVWGSVAKHKKSRSAPFRRFHPCLNNVRAGPRFQDFARRMGLSFLSLAVLTRAELLQRSATGLSPTCAEPYPLRALASPTGDLR